MGLLPPDAGASSLGPASVAPSLPGLTFESGLGAPPNQPQAPSVPPIAFEVIYEDLKRPITALSLSEEEERDLVTDVLAAIAATDDSRRERLATVQKVRDRYYLATPNRTPPFEEGANWHIPFTRWVLDAVHARLWGNSFGTPNWVMVTGVKGAADVDLAARTEPFLQYVNAQELELPRLYDDALERALTDGFVMVKVPWERRVRRVRRRRLQTEQIEITDPETNLPLLTDGDVPALKLIHRYVVDERDEEVSHGPRAQLVTIDNFIAPNPNVSRVTDQPWVAQQFWLTRDQLWMDRERQATLDGSAETVGLYRHVEEIITVSRRADTNPAGTESHMAAQEGASQAVTTPDLVGEVRCYEILWPYRAWKMARYPGVRGDELPDRAVLTIAADEAKLLRGIHYPFWDPYPENYWVKAELIGKEGRWYSQALGEIIMSVQDELDTIHWQRTDATTVMILAFFTFLAEEGAADTLEKIKLGQRNVVESLDGVKLLADLIKISLQAPGLDVEQLVLKFGELLSAIAEPQLGSPTRGDKTAFEIGTIVREGNLKFTKMIAKLAESIVAVCKIVLRRYAQFYPLVAPKIYRVTGGDDPIREMALDDLNIEPDLMLRGQSVAANREIEAAKALRVLQMAESSTYLRIALLGNPDGVYELLRTFLQQVDWPGGAEVLLGAKSKAVATLRAGLQAMSMMMGLGGPGTTMQGNGQGGPNLAALKPLMDLLNKSGLATELAALGQQATGGGVSQTGS